MMKKLSEREYIKWSFILLIAINLGSCEDFVETQLPINQISEQQAFNNDESLEAVLRSAYGKLASSSFDLESYPPLFSDEMGTTLSSSEYVDAQQNTYNAEVDYRFFINYYDIIYVTNNIIENLENPNLNLSNEMISKVGGEALFLRAYCYYLLVNFYGNVPYVTSTNAVKTSLQPREDQTLILEKSIVDLREAEQLLSLSTLDGQRIRVNQYASDLLLSKIALELKDWDTAEQMAGLVIDSNVFNLTEDLNEVFSSDSSETIWQLWNNNGRTSVGSIFIPFNTGRVSDFFRPTLVESFEENDRRKTSWMGTGTLPNATDTVYYPFKYKLRRSSPDREEFLILLRLADAYLIRAEARAQKGALDGSVGDLNMIRERAGLSGIANLNKSDLLEAIYSERQHELFGENANRWFDLKRTNQADAVLGTLKSTYKSSSQLLPIPNSILERNPNLTQNPGY